MKKRKVDVGVYFHICMVYFHICIFYADFFNVIVYHDHC